MPTSLTPRERSLRARVAAFAKHAAHDPRPTVEKAARAFRDSFLEKVDPQGVLPEEERRRRAEMAFRQHMASLSYKSARARKQRGGDDAA